MCDCCEFGAGRGSVENIQTSGLKEVKIVNRKVRRRQGRDGT